MPAIGPFSRPHTLAVLDGRTKEARLLRDFRADLVRHVGGKPSATQSALITQACQLQLRIALMDRAIAGEAVPSERNGREYLSWCNSLQRLLRQLGKGVAAAAPTLADHLANREPGKAPRLERLPRLERVP